METESEAYGLWFPGGITEVLWYALCADSIAHAMRTIHFGKYVGFIFYDASYEELAWQARQTIT